MSGGVCLKVLVLGGFSHDTQWKYTTIVININISVMFISHFENIG